MKERRIGIMGGTFNPIHYAHLLLGENAREQFVLDRVIFIPTGKPYLKDCSKIPSGELRYQLVKLAIANNPYFTCSRLEIDRPGNTYTADTLHDLKKMYPGDQLFFIMGADSLFDIERWNRIDEIFANCTLIASVRYDRDWNALERQRDLLAEKHGARIELLQMGRLDLSSTQIRERFATGKSVKYLLPEDCIEFIRMKNFYTGILDDVETAPDKVYQK